MKFNVTIPCPNTVGGRWLWANFGKHRIKGSITKGSWVPLPLFPSH